MKSKHREPLWGHLRHRANQAGWVHLEDELEQASGDKTQAFATQKQGLESKMISICTIGLCAMTE